MVFQDTCEELKSRFKPEAAVNLQASYLLNLSGDGNSVFLLKINKGELDIEILDASQDNETDILNSADCCISASYEDFQSILDGKMAATTAALSGILSIDGELSLALQLLPIFFAEQSQFM